MNSGADHAPTLAHRAQRRRHQRADRRIDDGAVQLLGRSVVGAAGPARAEFLRKRLCGGIAGAGEGIDVAALPARHLGNDVRGRAEAVKADFLAVAGHSQRAPADQSRAQQRRRRHIGSHVVAAVGQPNHETGVGNDMAGIAAVARVAGKERLVAQVFPAFAAVPAMAASSAEPGNADAHAVREPSDAAADGVDPADDFVAGHDGEFWIRQFAVDDMEVGAANPAGGDPNPHLAIGRLGIGPLLKFELFAGPLQHHRVHCKTLVFDPAEAHAQRRGGVAPA